MINAVLARAGREAQRWDYDSLPTRSSLLGRLRNVDDDASWRVFFETYWRLIYNVARKSGLSDDEAQEVVQETVISVARKMPAFQYDSAKGSFKHWLLLITRRRIQDYFRRRYRATPLMPWNSEERRRSDDVASGSLSPDAEIDAAWEEEWQNHLFETALGRVRQKVNPKHYQVFDYCVLQNLPSSEVARMLGLNAAQIYLAKHRMNQTVKRAVAELEAELGPGNQF